MTSGELLSVGLDVFAVGVGFCIAWCCLAGMCVGALSLIRGYMGIGRG